MPRPRPQERPQQAQGQQSPYYNLLVMPIEDDVPFPRSGVTMGQSAMGPKVGKDERVLLLPRHDGQFMDVGSTAVVGDVVRGPVAGYNILQLAPQHRGTYESLREEEDGTWRADVTEHPDPEVEVDEDILAMMREYRAILEEIMGFYSGGEGVGGFLASIEQPGQLADTAGGSQTIPFDKKLELLSDFDPVERLRKAIAMQRESLVQIQIRQSIRDDVESGAGKQQREYFLRKQLESIRKELGEDSGSLADEYKATVEASTMPPAVKDQALREVSRLERTSEMMGEAAMIRTYLDWLTAVPWGHVSQDHIDPEGARRVLDEDHAGLDDVKDRVVEYLAVRKLRAERGITSDPKSGAILTFVGPPGTGKTSIGESVARATGRRFQRISLGGLRDESEIRGHRRTYIGALPGRLVRALRDAGTMNPVIVLDEIDKVGSDWRGDPAAALLEVLDPAQNHTFRDHYLDVDIDLSQVMFIATANVADTIPSALIDRMEIISFDGYTVEEKLAIARQHLLPRQEQRNGLREGEVSISDEVLRLIIDEYTREAGVRSLERELGKMLRKLATEMATHKRKEGAPIVLDVAFVREALGRQRHFQEAAQRTAEPGVATGLAVTQAGGDVLFIEATRVPSAPDKDASLLLTGQLGDVMKESAQIALSYVQSHASDLGIDTEDLKGRFHLHIPAGAIPKDGPSAGVAMTIALTSLLTGRPVRGDVGMTGEMTLQGRVLPIGGLKQKILAAHAAGLTDVIFPERNEGDLKDVPEGVRAQMSLHPVSKVGEALEIALAGVASPAESAQSQA
jgi:ATP-dependent Lon protease